jgi:hypothetical protein
VLTSDIKQELNNLSSELKEIAKMRWDYLTKMVRFSLAAWIFGFACFFSAILYLTPRPSLSPPALSLLLPGEAAALIIIAIRLRSYDLEIRKLKEARRKLLLEYQKLILTHIKRTVRGEISLLAKPSGESG